MPDKWAETFYFNLYALPVFVVAVLIPMTGFYIYLQNRKSAANFSFFLLCLAILCWLSGQTGVYATRDPRIAITIYRSVAFAGVVLISPLVYFFSTAWLGLYERKKGFVWGAFSGAAFFYALGLFSDRSFPGVRQYFWGYYPIYGPYNWIFLVFFFSYFFAAFYNFFKALGRETEKVRILQIKYILAAFLVSFLSSLDYIPKIISFPLYPLGFLYVFTWISLVAYSIIRYKAMDIETVVHKTIMWFLSTVTAVAPFALVIHFSQSWIKQQNAFVTTGFSLFLLLVFYGYFHNVQPWLDRIFRRRMVNLSKVFNRFASELVHLKSLRDLLQYTARILRKTVFAETISIYLKTGSGEEIYPAIAKKIRGLNAFPISHPFLAWIEKHNDVVVPEFAEGNPALSEIKESMLDYTSKTQAALVIPFVLGDKLIGLLHLGRKENLKPYTAEEILFLGRMKSALTIAFSNSLQFIAMRESLEKWNDELEKKVEERTQQLQDTQTQLIQAEKLATIGTLAGGVAHEINNPLTAVLANAQILKISANADDIESLELIEEGAKRCQTIIQKLMKYARKPMEAEIMGKIDINKVVDSTVAFLKYQMDQENVKLKVEKTTSVPLIKGNANELEQVLTNLILNGKDAVKDAGREGIITISTAYEQEKVIVQVADNGIGISEENLKKIFDPFFTTKELGKGTGLGLAVSMGIVEKHGGFLTASSRENIGTTFKIEMNLTGE